MPRKSIVIAALLASWYAAPSYADPSVWTRHGPFGGNVQALVLDPTAPATLYAGLIPGAGLFKTTDGAASWSVANREAGSPASIMALAIDPQDPGTLYASFDHVFKSIDGGRTWKKVFVGLAKYAGEALAVDPTASNVVYAGLGFHDGVTGGIVKSIDGGEHWEHLGQGLPQSVVSCLAIDPTAPSTLYMGFRTEGVYKSVDGGATWFSARAGMTTPGSRAVGSLAVDPSTPGTIYATTQEGVYKSKNGAQTWSSLGPAAEPIEALAIDPVNSTVYAATLEGFFKSTDAQDGWTLVSDELKRWWTRWIVIDPRAPSVLYAATQAGGVFKSVDGGESWSLASEGMAGTEISAVVVDPRNRNRVYAGIGGGGVARSTNHGVAWEPVNQGLDNVFVLALAMDPLNPDTLYASGADGVFRGGIYKTTNGGDRWRTSRPGIRPGTHLVIDPQDPATVYADLLGGTNLLKTTDGGATWKILSTRLPGAFVSSLAIDPVSPRTLYAATSEGGVYKTLDGGTTWFPVDTGLSNTLIASLAIDPTDPGIVYAAEHTGGRVFRSVNGGGRWTLTIDGLPTAFDVARSIVIAPERPKTLYLGLEGHGVFESTDGASTWSSLGLDNQSILSLAVDPVDPTLLYAGTAQGVFRFGPLEPPSDPPPVPPDYPYLSSGQIPGFRFKVRITGGQESLSGRNELDCLGETLCVSGALPGRSEAFLRVIGPRPNGYLWVDLVRFTTSRLEVWAEQTATGEVRYYDLPALPRNETELSGLVDKDAFLPVGAKTAKETSVSWRVPDGSEVDARTTVRALTFVPGAFPGYRFTVRILANGEEQSTHLESDCLAETVCVSGAVHGRSELFLRIIGPRPNGLLWVDLVRFTTSRVEVEVEQLATGMIRSYVLDQVPRESDQLPGRVDRQAFFPS